MRWIIGFVISFISLQGFSADLVRGLIYVDESNQAYLKVEDSPNSYLLKPASEVIQQLRKLKSGDYLAGSGEIINNQIKLQSIHFVGLAGILGLWQSQNEFMDFENFSQVKLYDYQSDFSKVGYVALKYTLTPGKDQDWRMYLTDGNSVTLASLTLTNNTAKLVLYNSHTGQIIRTLNLTRLNYYQ